MKHNSASLLLRLFERTFPRHQQDPKRSYLPLTEFPPTCLPGWRERKGRSEDEVSSSSTISLHLPSSLRLKAICPLTLDEDVRDSSLAGESLQVSLDRFSFLTNQVEAKQKKKRNETKRNEGELDALLSPPFLPASIQPFRPRSYVRT